MFDLAYLHRRSDIHTRCCNDLAWIAQLAGSFGCSSCLLFCTLIACSCTSMSNAALLARLPRHSPTRSGCCSRRLPRLCWRCCFKRMRKSAQQLRRLARITASSKCATSTASSRTRVTGQRKKKPLARSAHEACVAVSSPCFARCFIASDRACALEIASARWIRRARTKVGELDALQQMSMDKQVVATRKTTRTKCRSTRKGKKQNKLRKSIESQMFFHEDVACARHALDRALVHAAQDPEIALCKQRISQ